MAPPLSALSCRTGQGPGFSSVPAMSSMPENTGTRTFSFSPSHWLRLTLELHTAVYGAGASAHPKGTEP